MYEVWVNKNDKEVPICQLTDLHLLHIIRGIVEGRLFPSGETIHVGRNEVRCGAVGVDSLDEAGRWLIVLKAEAIRRGLDWIKPPSRKVGLIDWLFEQMHNKIARGVCFCPDTFKKCAAHILAEAGITQPEIDVSNLNGRPSYMHWQAGGMPIKGE